LGDEYENIRCIRNIKYKRAHGDLPTHPFTREDPRLEEYRRKIFNLYKETAYLREQLKISITTMKELKSILLHTK